MARLQPAQRPRFLSRRFGFTHRARRQRRLLAWSLPVILIVFSSLMLIPPARAAIIDFIQIGIVRIFPRPVEVNPTSTTGSPAPVTATSQSLIPLLNQLAGKTTLTNAQQRVSFPILLPSYPPTLSDPDHVFVQEAEGSMVVLVWMDPQQPEQVLLSLHFIPSGSWAVHKVEPVVIEETLVNEQPTIWATGPYALKAYDGNIQFMRLIDGHVLIWVLDDLTYRLETDLPLEEALKIAESLQPASP